jgi:hypothetical protein
MTLRESVGPDVHRIYELVDALLDRDDGVLVIFDGDRVCTYANGFDLSASQLELLGVELERALRSAVGRQPSTTKTKRRRHDVDQGDRTGDRVDGDGDAAAGRVLRLASKIA